MPHMYCPQFTRTARATVLLLFYTLIAMGPVAPAILQSSLVAHAITGQCSGDCAIDGCGVESRARHTCCCWQRHSLAVAPEALVATDCCVTATTRQLPEQPSCCPGATQPEPPSCCEPAAPLKAKPDDQSSRPVTVVRCGCPCSGDTLLSLSCLGKIDLVPSRFFGLIVTEQDAVHVAKIPAQLYSHIASPPTPPPECRAVA